MRSGWFSPYVLIANRQSMTIAERATVEVSATDFRRKLQATKLANVSAVANVRRDQDALDLMLLLSAYSSSMKSNRSVVCRIVVVRG